MKDVEKLLSLLSNYSHDSSESTSHKTTLTTIIISRDDSSESSGPHAHERVASSDRRNINGI